MELISVIIPVYNVEQYLDRCLNSIINQTYRNLEIIVIDDGSTDKSNNIIHKYIEIDDRIIIVEKNNGGLSDARNAGIEKASGNYLTFVDSDDIVALDYIEYLYNLIQQDGATISTCCYQTFSAEEEIIDDKNIQKNVLTPVSAINKMLYRDHLTHIACGKLYKADLFFQEVSDSDKIYNIYNEQKDWISFVPISNKKFRFPKNVINEDYATVFHLFSHSQCVVQGYAKKYYYFERSDSIVMSKLNEKSFSIIHLIDVVEKYLLQYNESLMSGLLEIKVSIYVLLLKRILREGYNQQKQYQSIILEYLKRNRKLIFCTDIRIVTKIRAIVASYSKSLYKFLIIIEKKLGSER